MMMMMMMMMMIIVVFFWGGGGGEWQDPFECIQHDDLTMLDDV